MRKLVITAVMLAGTALAASAPVAANPASGLGQGKSIAPQSEVEQVRWRRHHRWRRRGLALGIAGLALGYPYYGYRRHYYYSGYPYYGDHYYRPRYYRHRHWRHRGYHRKWHRRHRRW